MQEKATLSVKEAAAVMGVSLPIMYSLTERADFDSLIKVGRKKIILKSRFFAWLDMQTAAGARNG